MKTSSLLALLATAPLLSVSHAGTVTTTADSGPGSLRQAIIDAVNPETIDFDVALNGATITLITGVLTINTQTIDINASALPSGIQISGNGSSGVFEILGSTVALNNMHIRDGKKANINGGGVYAVQSQIDFENCSIRNCSSKFDGGGLWGNGITGSIVRSEITGNRSENFGGGIFLIGVNSLDVTNSSISGNFGVVGGGIYSFASSPVFTNCVIQGNFGKGLVGDINSQMIVRNSIVWGNRTGSGSNIAAMQFANAKSNDPNIPDSSTTVAYSLVEKASGGASFGTGNAVVWGTGNLNGALSSNAPHFISEPAAAAAPTSVGDLRVFTDSPVIDAGENASSNRSTDLAGRPRIQNGTVDIGAFEGGYVNFSYLYPLLDSSGDSNNNGVSNFLEYALGLDPAASSHFTGDSISSADDGSKFITFTGRSNGTDFQKSWETSDSLAFGSWQPMVTGVHFTLESTLPVPDSSERSTLRLIPLGPVRFYRQTFTRSN